MNRFTGMLSGLLVALVATVAQAQSGGGSPGGLLNDLSRDIRTFLDHNGNGRVVVGDIQGGGPTVRAALADYLRRLGVQVVDSKGHFELGGDVAVREDPSTGRRTVQIRLELRDRQGNVHFFQGKQYLGS